MSFSNGTFLPALWFYSQSFNFPCFHPLCYYRHPFIPDNCVFPKGAWFLFCCIFFFSSFHYTHCHLVTVFMSCLLFSLTVNNLFYILGLHHHVFISFLNANFSCHLCWWRFLFSPDYRSSADAVSSFAQSPEHCSAVDVICHSEQYASFECLSLHLKMLDHVSVSFTLFVPSSSEGVTLA